MQTSSTRWKVALSYIVPSKLILQISQNVTIVHKRLRVFISPTQVWPSNCQIPSEWLFGKTQFFNKTKIKLALGLARILHLIKISPVSEEVKQWYLNGNAFKNASDILFDSRFLKANFSALLLYINNSSNFSIYDQSKTFKGWEFKSFLPCNDGIFESWKLFVLRCFP